jgi:hypothetical protein
VKSALTISKAGWSWGCVSAIDSSERIIWIADAHRRDGKRFVVRADEKLIEFMELESSILDGREPLLAVRQLTKRGIPVKLHLTGFS